MILNNWKHRQVESIYERFLLTAPEKPTPQPKHMQTRTLYLIPTNRYMYIYIRYKREKKEVNMLCLEIPGCVQHKLMYGVVLREDLTHHNVEMLYLLGTARIQE